jgi:hypothetical protein
MNRTWLLRDLARVVESKRPAITANVLLERIIREAAEVWDASDEQLVLRDRMVSSGRSEPGAEMVDTVRAVVCFDAIKLANGAVPTVGISAAQLEDEFRVHVGGRPGSDMPGYMITFGLLDETPPELFRALFECALLSIRNMGHTTV